MDELETTPKSKLGLEGDVVIQFQDAEFSNELCNLTDMSELPPEIPRLTIILKAPPTTPSSVSSIDTGYLDQSMSSPSSVVCSLSTPHFQHLPDHFIIPTFNSDVELKLRKGNEASEKDGSPLTVTAAMKREILDRVGSAMYKYSAYPVSKQIVEVAKSLVAMPWMVLLEVQPHF